MLLLCMRSSQCPHAAITSTPVCMLPAHDWPRGWLIFFTIAEILAKGAGTLFGWSLHRSLSAGGGEQGEDKRACLACAGGWLGQHCRKGVAQGRKPGGYQ
jgi:hypothetical protein